MNLKTLCEKQIEKFDEKFHHQVHCDITDVCGCGLDNIKVFFSSCQQELIKEMTKFLFEEIGKELSVRARQDGGVPVGFADGMTVAQTIIITQLNEAIK